MSYGQKIKGFLDQLVPSVVEILEPNFDKAIRQANALSCYEDYREFYNWLKKVVFDAGKLNTFGVFVSAAFVSDIMQTIKQAILADNEVEDEELELALDLLRDVISEFSWQEGYEHFDPLIDLEEVRDLLETWENDKFYLGGNYREGAVVFPFSHFVVLACILNRDTNLHDTFTQMTLLITKIILSLGGIDENERTLHNKIKEYRFNESQLIKAVLNDNKNLLPMNTSDGNSVNISNEAPDPKKTLEESIKDLETLVGVPEVKAEIQKLTNFLKVRQQRQAAGLPLPSQSLHFVFTGNPGTGKTTVARIVSRILYGFGILQTPTLIEADRAMLVGGYVGQTAIKTSEVIEKAINGVLFIDEAYTLSKKDSGNDFGQEAIDTLLKKMEDYREKLVVIVAGYPKQMKEFLATNPGLESRFTRFVHFDDYHVSDLCQIYERLCLSNSYKLTQQARANLAIVFNRAYSKKDEKFGNARFVRNIYEKTLGNHADRLANQEGLINKEMLSTIEASDIPYGMVIGLSGPFDASDTKWNVECPGCRKATGVGLNLISKSVSCKCGAKFRCPWWNLKPESLPSLNGFKVFDRPSDLIGYDLNGK